MIVKKLFLLTLVPLCVLLFVRCSNSRIQNSHRIKPQINVIFDTDANNELDDQHAIAYLLFNSNTFNVLGITVNATRNGGNIDGHYTEAERVMKLCAVNKNIPLLKGANDSFEKIKNQVNELSFDGSNAVNFIINEAKKDRKEKLVVIAVGKLTNIALAMEKDPSIAKNIRLVWLGANYPDPGEYNLVDDIPAMNYLLNTNIEFDIVTVRYGNLPVLML